MVGQSIFVDAAKSLRPDVLTEHLDSLPPGQEVATDLAKLVRLSGVLINERPDVLSLTTH